MVLCSCIDYKMVQDILVVWREIMMQKIIDVDEKFKEVEKIFVDQYWNV